MPCRPPGESKTFFAHWTGILTVLSEMSHIVNLDQTGRETINGFYNANRDQIKGITRVDAKGRIIYTIPVDENIIGTGYLFPEARPGGDANA